MSACRPNGCAGTPTLKDHPPMKTVRFDTDWFRNGQVVYPAGVDLPSDGHNEQLIADGVAGSVTDVGDVPAESAEQPQA